LEVAAYDEDRRVAQGFIDVQVLDDPAEFQDPRPDRPFLESLANASGGKVLQTAEDLAQLANNMRITPGEVVVQRAPIWDHAGLWLLLLGLLSVEWVIRRRSGLA